MTNFHFSNFFFGLPSLHVLVPRQFARVCHSMNMEWSVKENHAAVTALHNFGKCYSQIFKLLKGFKISCMFVYRATKHYEELWRVEERALLGHLRRLRAQAASKTVLEQIRRNPLWKRKIMSQEPNILIQSKSHFIRDDQHMTVYTSQRDTSSLLL